MGRSVLDGIWRRISCEGRGLCGRFCYRWYSSLVLLVVPESRSLVINEDATCRYTYTYFDKANAISPQRRKTPYIVNAPLTFLKNQRSEDQTRPPYIHNTSPLNLSTPLQTAPPSSPSAVRSSPSPSRCLPASDSSYTGGCSRAPYPLQSR